MKPEFTSICQPLTEIGIITAQSLLKRMELGMSQYQPIKTELRTSFYITDSVADFKGCTL